MRLIDSNALIGALHNVTFEDGTDREIVYRCVELTPTIEERKTGKWVHTNGNTFKCSICGNFLNFHGVNAGRGDANYCPNCGAKMEVDE